MTTANETTTSSFNVMDLDNEAFNAYLKGESSTGNVLDVDKLEIFSVNEDEDPSEYFAYMGIKSKDDYILHRDTVKRCIRVLAARQTADRMVTRDGKLTDRDRDLAHYRRSKNAKTITQLIVLRRAGKAWSAGMAVKAKDPGSDMSRMTA